MFFRGAPRSIPQRLIHLQKCFRRQTFSPSPFSGRGRGLKGSTISLPTVHASLHFGLADRITIDTPAPRQLSSNKLSQLFLLLTTSPFSTAKIIFFLEIRTSAPGGNRTRVLPTPVVSVVSLHQVGRGDRLKAGFATGLGLGPTETDRLESVRASCLLTVWLPSFRHLPPHRDSNVKT